MRIRDWYIPKDKHERALLAGYVGVIVVVWLVQLFLKPEEPKP